ncbi:MAG TPA: saccharopine dehydrogenase C-terminal domain-containing protein [Flavisolibacter sp.]|nr:saccharopine dehydrogenase C-terminal domain-containing protein [Flavisolibacter sp.]
MKTILLFGAGKSATALITYLLDHAASENWQIVVVDANRELAEEKVSGSLYGKAVSFDINNEVVRNKIISDSDIVISLLPPALHFFVAQDCLRNKKNLLTASYVDENMRNLVDKIEENDLLFLCEMGLDPGIDHMSAKKIIDEIHADGGKITSFLSHCGGLIAPESDDNPWHYKISWNPRNIVLAGKDGAIYKKDSLIEELEYEDLFTQRRFVSIPELDVLCWYPNRDSLKYIPLYGLQDTNTFIRTTLRHPDFLYGWKNVVDLKLTDEKKIYNTDNKSLAQWFKEHMNNNAFSEWLESKLQDQFSSTTSLLSELVNLVKLEEEADKKGVERVDEFMVVDEKGDLQEIDIDYLKVTAAAALAERMHDANLTLKQLFFLGMNDELTMINRGMCSAADVLQFALENKLSLNPTDKDMVVMLHQIEFEKNGSRFRTTSSFIQTGEDATNTAMAKTVGMPLGVAAKLILNGTIQSKGLKIPITKEIYEPVLQELKQHGIKFQEKTEVIR